MQGFAYLRGVTTLRLDPGLCNGCRMCAVVCPHEVFVMAAGKARVERRDACMECGACACNCATGAVTVDAGVGCAEGVITEWLRGLRRKPPAACC